MIPGRPDAVVNRVVIEKGFDRQLILYWYQDRGRIVASEYAAKGYLILDATTRNRTDGALVRISTPIVGTEEEAFAHATAFVKQAFPALGRAPAGLGAGELMLALPDSIWLLPLVAAALAAAGLARLDPRPALGRGVPPPAGGRARAHRARRARRRARSSSCRATPSSSAQAALSLEFLRMAALLRWPGPRSSGALPRAARARPPRRTRVALVGGLVGARASPGGASFSGIDEMTEGAGLVRLGPNGRWLHVALLLGLVLALAQLESVLRASRDPFRFRIKFVDPRPVRARRLRALRLPRRRCCSARGGCTTPRSRGS